MSLLVCTMNYSWPSVDWSLLRRSGESVGINILTWGDGNGWPGYGQGKISDAVKFLRSRPEDVVLYTDSQDSFICSGSEGILQGWKLVGEPDILLQGETNCYPEGDWASEYPVTDSRWRYICAGGWMGRRTAIIDAMDQIMLRDLWRSGHNGCDQRCWTDWFLRSGQTNAKIDTQCEVFQSMGGGVDIDRDGRNAETKTYPSVFHFNGRTAGREELYATICTI